MLAGAVTASGCGDNVKPAATDAAVDAPSAPDPVETFVNPPELTPMMNPPNGTIGFNISVEPVEITLPDKNNNMNRHCLRQYVDASSAAPKTSIAGPTMRIPKGDGTSPRSVRMDLENRFSAVNQMTLLDLIVDVNTTNFHVHGLHASPNDTAFTGEPTLYWADNVLMSNCPQDCYDAMPPINCGTCAGHTPSAAGGPTDPWEYRFDIDYHQRHDPGTFWYHPHIHGTTALQLANGMSGALIVEDQLDDDICAAVLGDGHASCDNSDGGSKAFERILMIQTVRSQDPGLADGEACTEDTMTINDPNLDFFNADGEIPFFINGLLQPNLVMTANTPERWRFIQASTSPSTTIGVGSPGSDGTCATLGDNRQILYRMSADGLPLDRLYNTRALLLEPGYRYDVLLELPSAGSYCVWDLGTDSMTNEPIVDGVLATIDVVAGPGSSTLEGAYDAVNSLLNNFRCNTSALQPDCDGTLDPDRIITFRQGDGGDPGPYCAEPGLELNSLNGLRFNHRVLDRCLELDSTELWRLQATSGGHPFHIHINPFSVCKIVDDKDPAVAQDTGELCPNCTDTCGGDCDCGECIFATEECSLRPYLRDTLITRLNEVSTVSHTFENYTGGFVQHCHILPHEDAGMMQHIEVKVGCQADDERYCCANANPLYEMCEDPTRHCVASTLACTADIECCSGTCNTASGQCCSFGGDSCATNADCCSPVQTCADVGGGTMECTRFIGASCTSDAQCISGSCDTANTNTCQNRQ